MRRFVILLATLWLAGCARSDAPPAASDAASGAAAGAGTSPSATSTPATSTAAAPPGPACPATGLWAPCSLLYHLNRAGMAARVDSGAVPEEAELGGQPLMYRIGRIAVLELHVYPDSTARIADARKLDRADFVNGTAAQTMKRERTLIESANVIGLLTSLNDHQRERVSDAITAGPPQPAQAVRIGNPSNP